MATNRLPRRAETTDPAGPVRPALSKESEIAGAIKALVLAGQRDAARERFGELVARQQRRAVRIAYQYLRDVHDADEAVQDAFVKVFTHITTYREDLPFEVWFTRILVNGCLDLRKARARRLRWALPMSSQSDAPPPEPVAPRTNAEARLISAQRTADDRHGDRAAAEPPARGVHALPHRRADHGRSEPRAGAQRSDGARASVPRRPQAARAAAGR